MVNNQQKKAAKKASVKKVLPPSPDKKKLHQRIAECMAECQPPMKQSDLLRACATALEKKVEESPLSQQLLSQIMKGDNETSYFVPVIAYALNVRSLWLQFGIGEKRAVKPNNRGPMGYRDREDLAFMQAFRELPENWRQSMVEMVCGIAVAMRASYGQFAANAAAATEALKHQMAESDEDQP